MSLPIARPTWYVYYKLRPSLAPTLLPLVQAMQAELAQQLNLQVRLQVKIQPAAPSEYGQSSALADNPPTLLTWMEIYQESASSQACMQGRTFPSWLQAAVDASAISTCLDGARHIECFMEMSLCA